MNKVTLCGRLVGEPETKYSPGPNGENKAYTKYRIAVPRKYKKQNEEQPQSDFFNCVCFGSLAEFASKYFHKGGRILIAGRIENDNYTKDGQTFYGTKIIVEEQEFADSRKTEHEKVQEREQKDNRAEQTRPNTVSNTSSNTVQNNNPGTVPVNAAQNNQTGMSQEEYQRQFEDFLPTDNLDIPFH